MYKPLRLLTQTLLLGTLLFSLSCRNEIQESIPPDEQLATSEVGPKTNPFTVENMQKAYANLRAKATGSATGRVGAANEDCPFGMCTPIVTTHRYYRFRPATVEQMIKLDESGIELWDEPMDVENDVDISSVSGNEPVSPIQHNIPEHGMENMPYMYAALPVDYPIPAELGGEYLAELFLTGEWGDFDPEEDMEAERIDPWEPKPSASCSFCPQLPKGARVNRSKNAVQQLKQAGIDLVELYNEAMRISGHADEVIEKEETQNARKYRPSGRITVDETALGRPVPVKGVLVKAKRWFNLSHTYTDSDGRFTIPNQYKKKVSLVVKFKNDAATVRGITSAWKVWQFIMPMQKKLGKYTKGDMQGLNYNFPYSEAAYTEHAAYFVGATFMNTLVDMQVKCAANGLLNPPSNLNVWVSSAVTKAASTPMLRRIAETAHITAGINSFLQEVVNVDIPSVRYILTRLIPDITCRYGNAIQNTQGSEQLIETFFHELSHAVHFRVVGSGYWTPYIGYIVVNGGYGNKSSNGSGRIAVSEAWAYYIGNNFAADYYDQNGNIPLRNAFRDRLESQIPSNANPSTWIPFGMFYDMTDNGEPVVTGVLDNVNTYTTAQLFRGLTPQVTSIQEYRTAVLGANNNQQSTQVTQLVSSYQW